jgi:hypothetical protein
MIAQAELQGKLEHKPWVLVVAGHGDRKPIATLELSCLLAALRDAGWIEDPELRLAGRTPVSGADGST